MTKVLMMLFQPRFTRIAALATLVYFVAEWVVSASWRGYYGYRDNPVGPLGVKYCGTHGDWPCSAIYPVMDLALIITGLAVVAVALSWVVRGIASPPHGLLLAVAGIGLAVSGVFTEQFRYPLYAAAITVFLVLGPVAVFLIGACGTAQLGTTAGRFTTLAGAAGVIGYVSYASGATTLLGAGGSQRLAIYSVLVAIIVAGCRRPAPAATGAPQAIENADQVVAGP